MYVIEPKGNNLKLLVEFTLEGTETYVDPDVVKLTVRDPDGAETVYQYGVGGVVSKVDTGRYQAVIPVDAAGDWTYCWWSTGAGKAATADGLVKVKANLAGGA